MCLLADHSRDGVQEDCDGLLLGLCRPLLSISNPFSRFKAEANDGAVEQNCRVAHEVPSKSVGIMLCLAIITPAFCTFIPSLKSQLQPDIKDPIPAKKHP